MLPWPAILLTLLIFSSASADRPEALDENISSSVQIIPKKPDKNERLTAIYTLKKEKIVNAVTAYFKNALAKKQVSGAGVSIVKGDSILFTEGFGKRKATLKDNINAQTVFRLGSLSKGFAGVLAGMYVNDGLLRWDSKIEDYVDGFQLGSLENSSQITLAKILSHTSGTPYHSYTNLVEAGLSLTDIAKRFKNIKPISKPGEIYSYQNAIFALSGTMIEQASGLSIGAALKERIFQPLGMKNASTDYKTLMASGNIAYPNYRSHHGWQSKKINDKYFNAVAAGGVNASPLDMAKWMRFLLGHNPEVADNSVLKAVFKPEVEIKGRAHYYQQWPGHISSHYAHGWRLHEFKDEKTGEVEIMIH
ncbi:hypothetical protein LCGC14_2565520, partial [marine sediment metagenome]